MSSLPPENLNCGSAKAPLKFCPKNPRITFLGTASQASSAYRNASGILVQMRYVLGVQYNTFLLFCIY